MKSAFVAITVVLALAANGCSREPGDAQHTPSVLAHNAALFDNGGFETGAQDVAPPEWTVDAYLNHRVTLQSPQTRAGLSLDASGGLRATRIVTGVAQESLSDPSASNVRYPKYGLNSAVINFAPPVNGNNQNVNGLKQQMTIAAGDVDPDDSKIHVRFVLAPVMENPAHDVSEQPYYFIQVRNVTRNVLLYQEFEVSNQPGVPWLPAPGNLLYTNWQLVDVSPPSAALAIGDVVETEVIAAGCSRGQHFGRVYVDAFGTALPGLFTSASAPDTVSAGSDLTYVVHYKNGAATSAAGTTLDFVVPPHTTFVSTSKGGACTGTATVSCDLGDVPAGGHGDFEITVHVDPTATGKITQGNYSIKATGVTPLLGSHVVTSIPNPDLVANVSSGLLRIGWDTPITYTITVSNAGSSAATGVSVDDVIPGQLTGATWTCTASAGASCSASGTGSIHDMVNLPVGATVTYTLTARTIMSSGVGQTTHTVTATLALPTGGTVSAIANETIEVRPTASITLSKSAVGSVVSNTAGLACGAGCTSATGQFANNSNVTLTAIPPSGGSFTGWGGGTCSGTMLTCTLTTLTGNVDVTAMFEPPMLATVAGTPQQTAVTTAFGTALEVLVNDPDGNPAVGVPVLFTAPASGPSAVLSQYSVVTGPDGHAAIPASANANPGSYQVTARVAGASDGVTFMLTNVGPPALLTLVSGNGQTVRVHEAASAPLVVKLTDKAGTPLSGVDITFTLPSSGASATLATNPVQTDASGLASATLTASDKSGTYTLTAHASGVTLGVDFSLTNQPGPAASITALPGSTPQNARVGTDFAKPLGVTVLDQYGNPVSGVSVRFDVPTGGPSATLSATSVNTDEHGEASVTAKAGDEPGSYELHAKLPDDSAATFALGNTTEDPRTVTISAGDGQSALATQPFGTPIVVEVRDAQGNPVSGTKISVSIAPDANGGTLSRPEVTTDSAGHALVELTAGMTPGTYTLQFKLDGGETPVSTAFVVEAIPTETKLTVSPDTAAVGDPVTLSATVSSELATPTGHVQFSIDGEPVGEAELDDGKASYEYTAAEAGVLQVSVSYDAQGSFAHSAAGPTQLEITAGGTGPVDGGPSAADSGQASSDAGAAPGTDTRGWRLAGGSGSCTVAAARSDLPPGAFWIACAAGLSLIRWQRRRAASRRA